MKTIQSRLTIAYLLFGAAIASLGYTAFKNYKNQSDVHTQLGLGYKVEENIAKIKKGRSVKRARRELKALRPSMQPEARALAVSDIITAINRGSQGRINKSIRYFENVEAEFKRVSYKNLDVLKKNVEYYTVISITLFITLYLWAFIYLRKSVFYPIKRISKKMKDFLVDKYTYHFSVPPDNEIGELQNSFNSMAQKVLTQMDELQALDNAKSEFLSIASHELRTPMTSIKGSLGLLQSGVTENLNDASLNLLNIAEAETDRLIRLINDILDLSKIEARMLNFDPSWMNIKHVIIMTLESLDGLAKAANVHLVKVDLNDIYAPVDQDRIQQVLTNLISNAVKYSPDDGNVFVGMSFTNNGQLKISIKDEGVGIAPEDQKLIFEKFRQATGKDNPLVKGTGLGLAIAKAFVEEHNGVIGVESKPGNGSEFYFTLPNWSKKMPKEDKEEVA